MLKRFLSAMIVAILLVGCSASNSTSSSVSSSSQSSSDKESRISEGVSAVAESNDTNTSKEEMESITDSKEDTKEDEAEAVTGFSDKYYVRNVLGISHGDTINENQKFWVWAESNFDNNEYLVLTDFNDVIYDELPKSDWMDCYSDHEGFIDDETFAIRHKNGKGYDYDLIRDRTVITGNYIDLEEERFFDIARWDGNIYFFTVATVENYNGQEMVFTVYEKDWSNYMTFTKSGLIDSFDSEPEFSKWNWNVDAVELLDIGHGLYCIPDSGYTWGIYIDIPRKTAFIERYCHNYYTQVTDGDFLYVEPSVYSTRIINLETNEISSWYSRSDFEKRLYDIGLFGDGKYWLKSDTDMICVVDTQGNILFEIEPDNTKIIRTTAFFNGRALIELENDGKTRFITMTDDAGNWLIEPVQGTLSYAMADGRGNVFFEETKQFCFIDGDQFKLIDENGNIFTIETDYPVEKAVYEHICQVKTGDDYSYLVWGEEYNDRPHMFKHGVIAD